MKTSTNSNVTVNQIIAELKAVLSIIGKYHKGEICKKTLKMLSHQKREMLMGKSVQQVAEEMGLAISSKSNERYSDAELDELLVLARQDNPWARARFMDAIMPKVVAIYRKQYPHLEEAALVNASFVLISDLIADEKNKKPVGLFSKRSGSEVEKLKHELDNRCNFSATTFRHLNQLDSFENGYYMENGRLPLPEESMKALGWSEGVHGNTIQAGQTMAAAPIDDTSDGKDGEQRGNALVLVSSIGNPEEEYEENELRDNLFAIVGESFTEEEKAYLAASLELAGDNAYTDAEVMRRIGISDRTAFQKIKRSVKGKLGNDGRLSGYIKTA